MLEKVDLSLSLTKEQYKEKIDVLGPTLGLLQRACWEHATPVMIVFEGWDASGKGTSINFLAQQMDPRGFKIHPIKGASDEEAQMPWLWRFWLRTPNYGEVAIFDRSWYGRVVIERVEKITPEALWQHAYTDITEFERTLAEDGYAIVKFFLHISKKEQKRRFDRLLEDPLQSWRVAPEDKEHYRKYDKYLVAIEEMLAHTDTEWAPWTIVEATDRRWSRIKIIETVCKRMEEALILRGHTPPPRPVPAEQEQSAAGEEE